MDFVWAVRADTTDTWRAVIAVSAVKDSSVGNDLATQKIVSFVFKSSSKWIPTEY